VVDNARKMIGKTIATQVTSVLQTTAGKMIFGRFPEEAEAGNSTSRQDRRPYDRVTATDRIVDEDRDRIKNR